MVWWIEYLHHARYVQFKKNSPSIYFLLFSTLFSLCTDLIFFVVILLYIQIKHLILFRYFVYAPVFFLSSTLPYNIYCGYSFSLNVSFPLPFIRVAICLSYSWSLLLHWYAEHIITLSYMDTKCRLQLQKKDNGIEFPNDLIFFWNILEDRVNTTVPEPFRMFCA